jgi:hypothetical protein
MLNGFLFSESSKEFAGLAWPRLRELTSASCDCLIWIVELEEVYSSKKESIDYSSYSILQIYFEFLEQCETQAV